ncbi:HD-GYP domain-containing protein [Magnetococcales bacterium HHB-1]
MRIDPKIDVFDLVSAISNALDLVDQKLVNHHVRVAYIATCIARAGYRSRREESNLVVAGLLHDLGMLSRQDRLEFFTLNPEHPHLHAEIGYQLLKDFDLFDGPARIIRFHHVKWMSGEGKRFCNEDVPLESHILHLADRLDILLEKDQAVIPDREKIMVAITEQTPYMFHPFAVDWLRKLVRKEEFWLDLTSPNLMLIFRRRIKKFEVELSADVLASFAYLISQLVDFRSRFTATHSSGVAATAEYIARVLGLSERECQQLMVAGYLHDIGKLAIPNEILEKPGRLTRGEYDIIKSHSYHTARILEPIQGIQDIAEWCAFHHEKVNGQGYPFKEVGANIPFPASILAVADIFTALTEDRPYRSGLNKTRVKEIFMDMLQRGELNEKVVYTLFEHYDDINDHRFNSQAYATKTYQAFMARLEAFEKLSRQEEISRKSDHHK